MVHNPREFTRYVNELTKNTDVVFTCINDDQPDGADGSVRQRFQKWMEKLFGGSSRFVRYERDEFPWGDGDQIFPDPEEDEEDEKEKKEKA
jgi:hypothetical protein